MPDTAHLLLFIGAGWLLNLTPGPDVLYIVTQGLKGGVRAGLVAALGIVSGCFVHVFAAAFGVGALLAASTTAFTALKWVGAGYLFWMGLKLLLSRGTSPAMVSEVLPTVAKPVSLLRVYQRGFLTNVLNPKVALFFLAFLPQFIAPTVEHKPLAFLLLGLLFNFNGLWVNLGWAVAAAWLAGRADVVQKSMHWLDRVAGALFIGFGIKLALTQAPHA